MQGYVVLGCGEVVWNGSMVWCGARICSVRTWRSGLVCIYGVDQCVKVCKSGVVLGGMEK